MVNDITQDNNTTVKRKKWNNLTDKEIAYLKEHAKNFYTIEERAADLGVAYGTYSDLQKCGYTVCGYTTLEKIQAHMVSNGIAA